MRHVLVFVIVCIDQHTAYTHSRPRLSFVVRYKRALCSLLSQLRRCHLGGSEVKAARTFLYIFWPTQSFAELVASSGTFPHELPIPLPASPMRYLAEAHRHFAIAELPVYTNVFLSEFCLPIRASADNSKTATIQNIWTSCAQ